MYSQTKEARAAGTATGSVPALGRRDVLTSESISQQPDQIGSAEHRFTAGRQAISLEVVA